jgi:hypothetical protein
MDSSHIIKFKTFFKDYFLNQIKINIKNKNSLFKKKTKKRKTFQAKLEIQKNFNLFTLNNIIKNLESIVNIMLILKLNKTRYKTIIDKSEMLITFNGNLIY